VANAFQGCLIGASLIVEGAKVHLAAQGQDIPEHMQSTIQLAVCCIGVTWQYKSLGSGQVPGLVKLSIFPNLQSREVSRFLRCEVVCYRGMRTGETGEEGCIFR